MLVRIADILQSVTVKVVGGEIAPGTYVLMFYTHYGHGEGYRVVRVSRKIRAVTP